METALRARLLGDAQIQNLCAGRVFWNVRPEVSALPAIVLQLISQTRDQHFTGFSGLRRSLVQITAFAEFQGDALAMRDAAIEALAPADDQGGVEFQRAVDVQVRALPKNTNSGVIHQEIAEMTFHHD